MSNKVAKKETDSKKRKNPLDGFKLSNDPDHIVKKALQIKDGKDEIALDSKEKLQLVMLNNLETGYALIELVRDAVVPRAIAFYRDLCAEYACETPSEKALAQLATVSFERSLDCSRRLNSVYSQGETTELLNKYMALTSKEQDRANRQYITAISTLKQIKSPTPQINVQTKNAFVAQNQQLNNYEDGDRKEIING